MSWERSKWKWAVFGGRLPDSNRRGPLATWREGGRQLGCMARPPEVDLVDQSSVRMAEPPRLKWPPLTVEVTD